MGKRIKGKHKRTTNVREPKPRFLIVCEGTETEDNYFRSFKAYGYIKGFGKNPQTLLNIAMKRCGSEDFDQVWLVFDKDENSNEEIEQVYSQARLNGIKIAFSNEAFELWFLLHFDYLNTGQNRQQLINFLENHVPEYEKNSTEMFDILHPQITVARQNAARLMDSYNPYIPHQANPSTTVYELVDELLKYYPN